MDKTFTAQFIASAIQANTDKHLSGNLARSEWSDEQNRLWRLAKRKGVDRLCAGILAPKTGGR